MSKQTQEWHAKWQLAQKRGASICSSIENLIKNHLASKDNSNLFNPDFTKSCEDLRIITSVFQDLIINLQKACDQLESSLNLPNINGKLIYGKTWNLENLIDFLRTTLKFYRKEYEIKLKVMGEFFNPEQKYILLNFLFNLQKIFLIRRAQTI